MNGVSNLEQKSTYVQNTENLMLPHHAGRFIIVRIIYRRQTTATLGILEVTVESGLKCDE